MAFAIGVSFFNAIQKLSNEDRGKILTFVGKFQENPAHPGLSLERIHQAKSENLWSARVSKGLRAIVVKDGEDWALVYVDHHDDAYRWTEMRSIERHSHTGALQIVELPTAQAEIAADAPHNAQAAGIFDRYSEQYLLSLGTPELWLPVIRRIANEDDLLEVAQKMPSDVADRLFDLATGKLVAPPVPIASLSDAGEEQSQNLFLVRSQDELRPLLDAPMATWIAFLHPTQKKLATGNFNGAVKITGSAGTGKTVVAMHRAKHLAGQGRRVLLTSFVNNLCHNLRRNLQLFCSEAELRQITVSTVHHQALTLLKDAGQTWEPAGDEELQTLLNNLTGRDCPLQGEALFAEWRDVIQAQGIADWEQYRSANRAGRGRALTVKDRKAVWAVVERFQQMLADAGKCSFTGLCLRALDLLNAGLAGEGFCKVILKRGVVPEKLLISARCNTCALWQGCPSPASAASQSVCCE